MGGNKPGFERNTFDRVVFSLVVLGTANVGIVLILRRHRRQVQPFLPPITEETLRRREEKITRSVMFIVGFYLLFNIPVLFVAIYHQILRWDINTYNHYSWAETLAFLNSCTNPSICFCKSQQIRQGVLVHLRTQRHSTRQKLVTFHA